MSDEYGGDFITIQDENGEEVELELVSLSEFEGKTYILCLPADVDVDSEDYGYIILEVQTEKGDPVSEENMDVETICFGSVDDDEELQRVYDAFMEELFGDEE